MKNLALLLFLLPLLSSCKKEAKVTPPLTVTDVDGNVYKTVKIGTQIWMAENLKTTKYRDKSPITKIIIDNAAWTTDKIGAYCDYNNVAGNAKDYGHLYNWYAVANAKNIAPLGWHVPSTEEFKTLYDYLSNSKTLTDAQISNALREKGTVHWASPNDGATNSTGFTALAGGQRNDNGTFDNLGLGAYFWSFTDYLPDYAYRSVIASPNFLNQQGFLKNPGFSIRCIKD